MYNEVSNDRCSAGWRLAVDWQLASAPDWLPSVSSESLARWRLRPLGSAAAAADSYLRYCNQTPTHAVLVQLTFLQLLHVSQTKRDRRTDRQTERHLFNGLFSRTTWLSRHQKAPTDLNFNEMMGWWCHQLDHMQIICTSLQTDNHASIISLNVFTGQMLSLAPNQQCQSTEGNDSIISNECIITNCPHLQQGNRR